MSSDTYEKPLGGWTCFHCGETFHTVGSARDHFGAQPEAVPGCLVRVGVGGERGLLQALRKAEDELAKLRRQLCDEDGPLHRELIHVQSRHSDALRTAEEAGYERGLRATVLAAQQDPRGWNSDDLMAAMLRNGIGS